MSDLKVQKQPMGLLSCHWSDYVERKPGHNGRRRYAWLQQIPVYRVIVAQLLVSIVLTLALLPIGIDYAQSSLLGGLCCSAPNAYFIWKAFSYRGARAARQIVHSFYYGEAGKLLLTVGCFILVLTQVKSLEPLALYGAFIAVQSVGWFVPLLLVRRQDPLG